MVAPAKSSLRVESRSRAAVTQHAHLAPAAIQGLEVLSLPVTELAAYVRDLVERNPLLDFDSDGFTVAVEDLLQEDSDTERDEWADSDAAFRPPARTRQQEDGFDVGRLRDECSETETLACHLRTQLDGAVGHEVPLALVNAIIDCINDDGYFDGSLPMICAEQGCEMEAAERALAFVQGLTPRGVGARTLRECLLLQLDDDAPLADTVRLMIEESLEDLADNRTTKLMRAYHVSLDDLAVIRRVIAGFDPRPGASFSQRKDTVYVIPDLVVERRGTSFAVRVTGELSERLVRHDEYEALVAASGDAGAASWLADKRTEADAALANVAQRKRTLFRFGMYLLEAQYGFFRQGQAAMRPLTMQQVADGLGLHVSTVSRIVADKHILTPWGTYPLKHFFSTALPATGAGGTSAALSSLAIKERIKALVAAEDARRPLSDAAITEALNGEGVEIKRRTVAKYREALGIPRQSQRRR